MQNFMTVTIKHKMLTTQLLMLLLLAAFIFRIQLDSNPTEEFRQWTMHALSVPTMGYDNLMDSVSSLITYLLGKKKKAINNFLGCASSVAIATGPAMTQSSCGFLREATFSATRSHRNVTESRWSDAEDAGERLGDQTEEWQSFVNVTDWLLAKSKINVMSAVAYVRASALAYLTIQWRQSSGPSEKKILSMPQVDYRH